MKLPLGNDKAKVLPLNLRNRMVFRDADEADAVLVITALGGQHGRHRYNNRRFRIAGPTDWLRPQAVQRFGYRQEVLPGLRHRRRRQLDNLTSGRQSPSRERQATGSKV